MSETITFENATVTLPCGPWQDTHEFTGEVRRAMPGETVITLNGELHTFGKRSDSPWPIIRPKTPAWQPPEYARGTGWEVVPMQDDIWRIECESICALYLAVNGVVIPVLAGVGWTIPPERKVWVC